VEEDLDPKILHHLVDQALFTDLGGPTTTPTVQRFAVVARVAAHRVVATDELVGVIGAAQNGFHP